MAKSSWEILGPSLRNKLGMFGDTGESVGASCQNLWTCWEGIDAVGDERALTEAEHLAANAELDGHGGADGKFRPRIHVEELGACFDAILGLIRKRSALGRIGFAVAEIIAAQKETVVVAA